MFVPKITFPKVSVGDVSRCSFGIARRGLRWRELSEHNKTKIYLKYFGLTRRGLKFPDKPNVYCTKSTRTSVDEKTKRNQFEPHKRV